MPRAQEMVGDGAEQDHLSVPQLEIVPVQDQTVSAASIGQAGKRQRRELALEIGTL